MYISGSLYHLVDLETLLLQKLGPACVAAYNAYAMCVDLPKVAFLAMDARHCAGAEMAEMMAYAASVGSAAAQRRRPAPSASSPTRPMRPRIISATTRARHDAARPHRLCRLDGARRRDVPRDLPRRDAHRAGRLFRPRGDRYARGLPALSRARRRRHAGVPPRHPWRALCRGARSRRDPTTCWSATRRKAIRGYRTEAELRYLVGTGVSAAAIWHVRRALDEAGFPKVKIVASSGFAPAKCRMMAVADAPIDVIGTGSYLPEIWTETYATADIVAYDDQPMVKAGREFLLRKRGDG